MFDMKQCIIFGAGIAGRRAFYKLSLIYDIVAHADNNRELWGGKIHDVDIINPTEIINYAGDVVICSEYFDEIWHQLLTMGVEHIRLMEPGTYFLYEYMPQTMLKPVENTLVYVPYKKIKNTLHILFVQKVPCIRTHKIAEILRARGIDVSIAYTGEPPEASHPYYANIYSEQNAFFSAKDMVDYVNNSEYDLVHCSNEPDSLTNIMLTTNKPVVHDTHDFISLCYKAKGDMLTLEYLANTKSHGLIYVNEYNLQLAKERYGVDDHNTLVIENRPSHAARPKESLKKISCDDKEIHCVYEGSIFKNPNDMRYMENIWLKLAENGVHVHFYTYADPHYCQKLERLHPLIHYEGAASSVDLLTTLTQYDCGLVLFQELPEYQLKLDTSLPNKLFEYISAGLPIVVGDVKSYREFTEKYHVGAFLDFDKDIKKQITDIIKIKIPANFIEKENFTMDDQADKMITFYQKIIAQYKRNIKPITDTR